MKSINELIKELDEIEGYLKSPVDNLTPEEVLERGSRITNLLPNCSNICADIKKKISLLKWDYIQENNLLDKKNWTEITREAKLNEYLSDLNYHLSRAESYQKTMYTTIEWCRSVISYLKNEMTTQR